MSVRIGPAGRGDHVFGDELRDLAEVPWQRQQLGELARNGVSRSEPVHESAVPSLNASLDRRPRYPEGYLLHGGRYFGVSADDGDPVGLAVELGGSVFR